jgi:hypothetical protein
MRLAFAFLSSALVAFVTSAQAQNPIVRGDVQVHYSALSTTSLSPEVARQYAIIRSAGRGLLNIAVLRGTQTGLQRAIPAAIAGAATNLAGQRQILSLREVREGEAIYYLAEPRIDDGETLEFELAVTPDGESSPIEIRFRQQFFAPTPR